MASNSVEVHNPIYHGNAADPFAIQGKHRELNVLVTQTVGENGMINMPRLVGSLDTLHNVEDAMPVRPVYSKEVKNTWAPHATQLSPDLTVVHFASGIDPDKGIGHGIGVGVSRGIGEPVTPLPELLVGGDEAGFRHIDAMVFVDPATDSPYLVWGSGGSPLMMQQLSPDLMQFAPGSLRREVFSPPAELGPGVVEAPWIVYNRYAPRGTEYVMYFSFGDCFGDVDRYRMGVAVAGRATGPYRYLDLAIRNGDELTNAGHHTFVVKEDGQLVSDAAGQLLMLVHCIPNEIVKANAGKFMERVLAAMMLNKGRLRSGGEKPWLGGVLGPIAKIPAYLVGESRARAGAGRKRSGRVTRANVGSGG